MSPVHVALSDFSVASCAGNSPRTLPRSVIISSFVLPSASSPHSVEPSRLMTTLPVARASPVLTLYLMSFAERVVATFFVAGFCCAGAASAAASSEQSADTMQSAAKIFFIFIGDLFFP